MTDINFTAKVKENFEYLETQHGYRLTHESNSIVRPETDGAVEYTSRTTGILIDSETGYVTMRVYRLRDGKNYYLTPIDIHEYLNTDDSERKLLLSANSADKDAATALFSKIFLLNQPGWKDSRGTVQDLDKELKNFANWLRDHSYICLDDNFSLWLKLYEYKILRARAEKLRKGEDELTYTMTLDGDGKRRLVKQSVFKDELEYIERLKKEFSS